MSRRGSDQPRVQRLALREVVGNLAFTARECWAWFVVPTVPWAFRSEAQREQLVYGLGDALAWLAGHRVHLRVTSRPYPIGEWARRLDLATPHPLDTAGASGGGLSWGEHLVAVQEHLRDQTMADKQVFLGVRLDARRSPTYRAVGAVWRKPGNVEHARLLPKLEQVTETIALPGLDGRPASPGEMEWLIRRSVGLGLPAPLTLSPVDGDTWEGPDLASFTDPVVHDATPFAKTVRVTSRHLDPDEGGPASAHVAVLTVGRVEEITVPETAVEPWLVHTDRLPFPVEWSAQLDVLSGAEARRAIQRKLLIVRDMQRHHAEHDLDEPLALDRQAIQAREVEDQMTRGADVHAARVHGWFRLGVTGASERECLDRVRRVVTSYRSRRITVEHPPGQYRLLREFTPGEPVSSTAYRRRLPVLYVAGGMPTVASALGDRRGPYVGYTAGAARRAVMFDTHYATEQAETSGLVPVVGGLGAGKSVLLGQITYAAIRRGIRSVVLDPSGPLARLCALPELAGHAEHLDLTTAASGTLNPFAVVATPSVQTHPDPVERAAAEVLAAQDRKLLALDVVKMLLPPAVEALPYTALVVSDAIRATHGAPGSSLWEVVEHLEHAESAHGRVVANYLRDMAELPLSRLLFPTAHQHSERGLGAVLTVLTMPGLVLPPRSVPREHWSTSEQLAVPLLHLAAWYATRAVYGGPMQARKLVALDETHFLGEWSAGRALFTRLGRDSRKWNTCVLAASQNPADVLGMDVANFMSAAFVGRLEDDATAADGLRMLRVPAGVGYERVLATLSPVRSGCREFVMRDVDGHVDKVRVDLTGTPALLHALDTTARPHPEVVA